MQRFFDRLAGASFRRLTLLFILPGGIISLLAGCSAPQPLIHCATNGGPNDIHRHVIAMDSDGAARDPVRFEAGSICEKDFAKQVKLVLDAMDEFHGQHPAIYPKKIMIFIHGGMNTPDSALHSADAEIDSIQCAGHFPIFVNWQSDLIDSYGEHLSSVNQGYKEYEHRVQRGMLWPFFLFSDVGRAATRLPITWINQVNTDAAAGIADVRAVTEARKRRRQDTSKFERWTNYAGSENTAEIYKNLRSKFEDDARKHPDHPEKRTEIQISLGDDNDTDPGRLLGLFGVYVLTSPVKFGTSWIIDGMGKSSWENMTRRTFMVFEGKAGSAPQSPRVDPERMSKSKQSAVTQPVTRALTTQETAAVPALDSPDFNTVGALDYFKNELAKRIRQHSPDHAWRDYEITLVGHSMGSMVLNEWVRRNDEDGMYYKSIVYMAAACSVRDFRRTIVPYLHDHKNKNDARGTTMFYNLTLHPTADLREKNRPIVGDLPARGSLLAWIDNYFTDPATPLDRTLGRWDNAVQSAYFIPADVRGQVTFKAMSLDPNDMCGPTRERPAPPDPQTHGSFRCVPYWEPSFWKAAEPKDRPETNRIKGQTLYRDMSTDQPPDQPTRPSPTTDTTTRPADSPAPPPAGE